MPPHQRGRLLCVGGWPTHIMSICRKTNPQNQTSPMYTFSLGLPTCTASGSGPAATKWPHPDDVQLIRERGRGGGRAGGLRCAHAHYHEPNTAYFIVAETPFLNVEKSELCGPNCMLARKTKTKSITKKMKKKRTTSDSDLINVLVTTADHRCCRKSRMYQSPVATPTKKQQRVQ